MDTSSWRRICTPSSIFCKGFWIRFWLFGFRIRFYWLFLSFDSHINVTARGHQISCFWGRQVFLPQPGTVQSPATLFYGTLLCPNAKQLFTVSWCRLMLVIFECLMIFPLQHLCVTKTEVPVYFTRLSINSCWYLLAVKESFAYGIWDNEHFVTSSQRMILLLR